MLKSEFEKKITDEDTMSVGGVDPVADFWAERA